MIALRPAPASAWRAYSIMCRWRLLQLRQEVPQIAVAQIFFATGTAIGLGFLIPDLDEVSAAYLATGAFLINLLLVAVVFVPGMMTEARVSGALDYLWAQPLSRLSYLLAELTIWAVAILPGMVVSLVVTAVRYDFDLRVSPLVVPAIALVLLSASSVGAAIGLGSTSQQMTNLVSNFVIIVILLFSPVNFPAERLPGWLQGIHELLPLAPMADLIRATLVDGLETNVGRDLVSLAVWCAIGMTLTWRNVNRAS